MSQIKARRKKENKIKDRLCSTKDMEMFDLSQGGGEEDNERRSCVYLRLSKIRPGRLSIFSPALVAGFIHFNKMNSESNQAARPLPCLPKPVSVVLASYTAL